MSFTDIIPLQRQKSPRRSVFYRKNVKWLPSLVIRWQHLDSGLILKPGMQARGASPTCRKALVSRCRDALRAPYCQMPICLWLDVCPARRVIHQFSQCLRNSDWEAIPSGKEMSKPQRKPCPLLPEDSFRSPEYNVSSSKGSFHFILTSRIVLSEKLPPR